MPTWSNHLPTGKSHMGFALKRTPTSGFVQAIVTCESLTVCDTHYWGGRTVPCERVQQNPDGSLTAGECAACNNSIPYRVHVYVSALDTRAHEHFIFECTAHAAIAFADYEAANGSLRGCIFHASRPKAERNSKVIIQTNTANLAHVQIPSAPNVIIALCTIWRVPLTQKRETENGRSVKSARPSRVQLAAMTQQPDNQPEPPTIGEILGHPGNGESLR